MGGDVGVMVKRNLSGSTREKVSGETRKRGERVVYGNALCKGCPALCCHTLLIPFKRPRTRSEIDYYKWHVQYDTVRIAIRARRWYLVVEGRCIYLDGKNLCTIYDRRPEICRKHNPPDCERYGRWYDVMIETPEELEAHLTGRKRRRKNRA